MFIEVSDVRMRQKSSGILPCYLVSSSHPDGLITLLKIIRGADHLLIRRLIGVPSDPADVRENVLARLDILECNGLSAGRCLRINRVACKRATGSSHQHEEVPLGHPVGS